jgi:outer membrane protein TolC
MRFRRDIQCLPGLAALLVCLAFPPSDAGAETLDLAEAIAEATGEHPSVVAARADKRIARAQKRKRGTEMLPALEAEGNLFGWNDGLAFSVGPGDQFDPVVIREQVTWDVAVRMTQPLTPLWASWEAWRSEAARQEAAEASLDRAERESARRAVVAYFEALEAEARLEVARSSVEQLESQLERVKALEETGAAQKSDRLRTEVALADARQQVSQAEARVELARSELATALGRDPGNPPEPAEVEADAPTAAPPPLDESLERATDQRPSLRSLERQLDQSRRAVRASRAQLLPRLAGLAQYKHTQGRGLTASDEAFVGLTLNWQFLQWGSPLYAIDEARARKIKVEAEQRRTRHQVNLEVRRAWHDLRSALDSYEIADQSVARAEEAYRVESERYEAGRATPTELLDTEAALTEARINRQTTYYDILVSRAELAFATGAPLAGGRVAGEGQ